MLRFGKGKTDNYTFIAVTYDGANPIPEFEKADVFYLYYMEGKVHKKSEMMSLYPKDTNDLIRKFKDSLIDKIICRNIGPKALSQMKEAGIEVYTFTGHKGAAIRAYESGELQPL